MRATLVSISIGLAMACLAGQSCHAAKIPIVFIYGSGDRIEKLADLPKDMPPPDQLGPGAAIGFKYTFYHLFWCSFWTSSGNYVVFHGDRYILLKKEGEGANRGGLDRDAEWIAQELEIPRSQLNRPFFYTFPLGLVLLGSGTVIWMLVGYLGLIPKNFDVGQLLQERRYQEAVVLALKERDPEEGSRKAVGHLVASGVSVKDARASMMKVLNSLRWAYVPTIRDRAAIPAIPRGEVEEILHEEMVQTAVEIARSHDPVDEAGVAAAGTFLVGRGLNPDAALTLIWNVLHPAPDAPVKAEATEAAGPPAPEIAT